MIGLNLFLKRLFDIVSCVLATIILLPFFIAIAIAVKCDSKGPVLFRQKRLSKNGKVYEMLKFRTMVVNAERMGAGLFNYENDPRVTKVGRLLRNTSLDELPQIWNVIAGSMSVVGPRPPVTYELGDYETLNKRYKKRFTVVPGITGWAQVNGRNDISWDDKVNFDNEYIDLFHKQGIWLDLKIIVKTVVNVFKSKDIYEKKEDESLEAAEAAALAEQEIIARAHQEEENE